MSLLNQILTQLVLLNATAAAILAELKLIEQDLNPPPVAKFVVTVDQPVKQ